MILFHRLGRALRFLRERQGRSQKEVAAAADVTPPMLSAYENERSTPELDTLDRLLKLGLGATLEDLRWAIDVVNDRVAAAPESLRTHPGAAAEAGAATGLPPELEQGCAEIARGLMRLSQAMVEAIHEASRRPGE